MKLYEYKNYDEYIEAQKKTTARKPDRVYARQWIMDAIADSHGHAVTILCHGTRGGQEQQYFKKRYPHAEIVGSELFPDKKNVPMTVIHDFNKQRPEWVGHFDIVYSNAFDHTITPVETFGVWAEQLIENGRLYIEWTEATNSDVSYSDPFGAKFTEIIDIAKQNGFVLEKKVLEGKARHVGTVLVFKKDDYV